MDYIIFGASNFGINVYKKLNKKYKIIAFCDNDVKKHGKQIEGMDIVSPEILKDFEGKVIIASMYHIEIAMQLIKYGIMQFYVYSDMNSSDDELIYCDYIDKDLNLRNNKITFIKDNNSGSNTLTLYNYMKENKDFEVVLVNEKNGRGGDYYYHILTSNIIIKSHEGSYIDGKINIQLWHGIPLKGLGFMNKNERVDCEKRHKIWNNSIVMSYSQMYSVLMGSCYGVTFKNFKITGMPRNDLLLKSPGLENLKQIFDIEGKKVLFYLPTYRESSYGEKNGSENGYIFSEDNIKIFDEFLIENNMIIIAKMHPFEEHVFNDYFNKNQLKNIYLLTEEMLLNKNLDIYELLNASDALITDYSSVYFDYLLLNKPMIFFNKDIEEYSETRGFILEPYDLWTPGPKCSTMIGLIDNLKQLDLNTKEYQSERERIKRIFHKYYDGNSCERIIDILKSMIN